jgi:hypothetical protein
VFLIAALSWWQFGPHAWGPGETASDAGPLPAADALKGRLDVLVREPGNPLREGLRLYQPGALPLKTADLIHIDVALSRPAYLYLVWLDSQGGATPLYPWQADDWRKLPPERRRDRLAWPKESDWAPLTNTPTGIEALLLLMREEPLPAGTDVAGLFAGLAAQAEAAPSAVTAWFEDGELVRDATYRGPPDAGKSRTVLDPVLQTQDLLRERLRPWFPRTRAVCFSFQGKARGG